MNSTESCVVKEVGIGHRVKLLCYNIIFVIVKVTHTNII